MYIEKGKVKDVGSCNACSRDILIEDGNGVVYPYDDVFVISFKMQTVRLCNKCRVELIKLLKEAK